MYDESAEFQTNQLMDIQEISLKKIYSEGYISRLFSKIIMISNHIAFVLLLLF